MTPLHMFRMTDRYCLLISYLTDKGSSHTEDYPYNSYTCSSKFSCLDICAVKLIIFAHHKHDTL